MFFVDLMPSMTRPISEILKIRRKAAGLRQSEVAKEIGVTPGAYGALEEGRNLPDIFKLIKLKELYKAKSIDELLGLVA